MIVTYFDAHFLIIRGYTFMNMKLLTIVGTFCLLVRNETACSDVMLLDSARAAGEALLGTIVYTGVISTGYLAYELAKKNTPPPFAHMAKTGAGIAVGSLAYQSIGDLSATVKVPLIAFGAGVLATGIFLNEYRKDTSRLTPRSVSQKYPFLSGCMVGLFFPVWKNIVIPTAKAGAVFAAGCLLHKK